MNIDQGLFKFDLTDYHAILGVSLEADAKQIRKRYLKIARKLHPDSLREATADEKQQASEILSKLVNPAYEKLSQEKDSTEYRIVLRLRGQQLSQQADTVQIQSPAALDLAGANNVDGAYQGSIQTLAEQQYSALDQVFAVTGQISELNMVYLMRTSGTGTGAAATPAAAPAAATAAAPSGSPAEAPPPPPPRQHRASILERYVNRAKDFESKKDYSRAIVEMREAIQSNPSHAESHAYLASLYLKAGQSTMARIHVKRALELNPNEPLAKSLATKVNAGATTKGSGKDSAKGSGTKGKGGGLFGLFGGKGK